MDALRHDLRSAVRALIAARGFTTVAVAIFALGIGINTALFSIVHALFLRPLPVSAPDEIVYVYQFTHGSGSFPMLDRNQHRVFREHREVFAGLTSHVPMSTRVTLRDETETRTGEGVLANYFDVLGVRAVAGRTFLPQDDDPAADPVIVISHRLWMRGFDGNEHAIGTKLRVCCFPVPGSGSPAGKDFTIVGVMGPEFHGVTDSWTRSDYWLALNEANYGGGFAVGRRRSDVTLAQVQEAVRVQGERLVDDMRQTWRLENLPKLEGRRFAALPAADVQTPYDPKASLVPARLAAALSVVVAVVLLIALINVAGLLMARGVSRAGETAMRRLLGAGVWRIARQLIAEGLMLALAGGVLGLLLAHWLLDLLRAATPDRFAVDARLDPIVLLFTLLVGGAAGLAAALVPVLQATRLDPVAVVASTGLSGTRRTRSRLRHWVLVPQVGLSLVVLIAAGLQLRTLLTLELADLGYVPDDVVVVQAGLLGDPGEHTDKTRLAERRAERSRTYYRRLLAGVQSLPGASAVAVADTLPVRALARSEFDPAYDAVTRKDALRGQHGNVGTLAATVGPGYFRTMGIQLAAGRDFDERDAPQSMPAVIVSRALVDRLWHGQTPLGREMALENRFPADGETLRWLRVVGVVDDVDPVLRDRRDIPMAYLAMSQDWQPSPSFVVARVPGAKQPAVDAMQRAVRGADTFAGVFGTRTLAQLVAEILYPRRMAAALLAAAGFIGLVLASVGLFGVMSYSVAQRAQEMGIRTALGAARADIVGLVVREGARVGLAGFVLGGVLAYWAWRVGASRISGVPPMDVATIVIVPLALFVVVLVACYVPARRAARVDPLVSLRRF